MLFRFKWKIYKPCTRLNCSTKLPKITTASEDQTWRQFSTLRRTQPRTPSVSPTVLFLTETELLFHAAMMELKSRSSRSQLRETLPRRSEDLSSRTILRVRLLVARSELENALLDRKSIEWTQWWILRSSVPKWTDKNY